MFKSSEVVKIITQVVNEIEEVIDAKLWGFKFQINGDCTVIQVEIEGEPQQAIRNMVANKYMNEGGYREVTHCTSSETNGSENMTTYTFLL